MEAVVANAADREQVSEGSKRIRRKKDDEIAQILYVMASKDGRAFVYRYLEFCGVYQTSYSREPNETFFREGQRNVGLMLMKDINQAAPGSYLTMLKEAEESKQNG